MLARALIVLAFFAGLGWWLLAGPGLQLLPERPGRPELVAATLIAGSGDEQIRAIAVHPDGGLLVAGRTSSADLPVTAGVAQPRFGGLWDGFVARVSADLTKVHWLTYFGGSRYEVIYGLAVHPDGDLVIAGRTSSKDLPGRDRGWQTAYGGGAEGPPYFGGDAFVARLSADGKKILRATYLGGAQDDFARHLAVDASSGRIAVGGSTRSRDFPLGPQDWGRRALGGWDAFLAILPPDLKQLELSAYHGGPKDDRCQAVALQGGSLHAAGWSASPALPWAAGEAETGIDVWGARVALGPAPALVGGYRFGGPGEDSPEQGAMRALGSELGLCGYVGPGALGGPWRTAGQPGGADAFAALIGPDGPRAALRFGGRGLDTAFGPPSRDANGRLWAVGQTFSADFPQSPPGRVLRSKDADAFVAVLSPDATELLHGVLFGGAGKDIARGTLATPEGVYVYGHTASQDFPTTEGAFGAKHRPGEDAFLTRWR